MFALSGANRVTSVSNFLVFDLFTLFDLKHQFIVSVVEVLKILFDCFREKFGLESAPVFVVNPI